MDRVRKWLIRDPGWIILVALLAGFFLLPDVDRKALLIGAFLAIGISYSFANAASAELQEEAEQLREETRLARHYTRALIRSLETQR